MKRAISKLVSGLCLALAFAPVLVLAMYTSAFEQMTPSVVAATLARWAIWPVACIAVAVLAGMLPGRRRWIGGLVGLVLLAGAGWLWYPREAGYLLPICCVLLYWYVLRAAPMPPFAEWHSSLLILGLGLHPICMVAGRLIQMENVLPIQRALFMVFLPVYFLLVNHLSVLGGASARDGSAPPWRIRAANLRLAIGFSVVVLIVANIGVIRDAFYALGRWIAAAVAWLMDLLTPAPAELTGAMPEAGSQEMMVLPPAETSVIWVILEKIATVVAIVAVAVFAFVLLRKLVQVLRKAARALYARIREAARQLGGDVQERTESILDWDEMRGAARERMARLRKRLTPPPRWQDLDNRARVRYTYAAWLRRHGQVKPAITAREALGPLEEGASMADIYERARYSSLEITEDEADYMRSASKQEK